MVRTREKKTIDCTGLFQGDWERKLCNRVWGRDVSDRKNYCIYKISEIVAAAPTPYPCKSTCILGAVTPNDHHPSRVTMLPTWWSATAILVTDTACLFSILFDMLNLPICSKSCMAYVYSDRNVGKTNLSFTRWNQRTQPFSWLRQRRSPRLM